MINIVFQDADLIIIEKPHDVLSVPGKGPDKQDCLISRLVEQGFSSALIVHRLDFATSGLMVVALNKAMHKALSLLFQNRQINKRYHALLGGIPAADSGAVHQPLRCDWENRPLQIVDYQWGKKALTHWQILQRFEDYVSVLLSPETGRSHQLRVHMQWLGHSILGDRFYAQGTALTKSNRLCLHASHLGFKHPSTGQPLNFDSDSAF